jgi:Tfp pilus assembly PilM family ATPase
MAKHLAQLIHVPALVRRRKRLPELITVLDLDGATLRIAQASNNETLKLVSVVPLDMAPDADRTDPLVVGASVSRALAKLGLKTSSVVMGLARSCVVLRNLRLPVLKNLPELTSMVHFQMAKDLPFPAEEAVIDFTVGREVVIPKEKADVPPKPEAGVEDSATVTRVEVLVAAVKRDVVEFHQCLAKAAGLKLSALGLLSYANSRCLEACKITDGGNALALICLRSDEVSADVMASQSLLFSRGAFVRPVGEAPHIDGAVPVTPEAFVQAAAIESVRSLHGYAGTEPYLPVGKVFVAGSTGLEAALLEALRSLVPVPCAQLDPADALRLAPELRTIAAGSIGAIGLALGAGDEHGLPFDFLNPKRPAVQRNLRRIGLLSGAAAAVALLIALLGVRKVLIDKRMALFNAANAELSQAAKEEPSYRTLINHAAVVGDWVKGGKDWLQHYAYLASVLPPSEEIYLTSLAVDNQGNIRLSVQARSGETLAQLDKQLRAAGYEVKPLAINPGADRFGYEFRSTVELAASPKIKIDLRKMKPVTRPVDDASLDPKAWKRGAK